MIYFLQRHGGGDIKIGRTECLIARLEVLEKVCKEPLAVLAVMDGSVAEETALHRRFFHLRRHGEWFHSSEELLSYIRTEGKPWNREAEQALMVTYASVKIDDELPPIIREAAAKLRISIQEFMSDALNAAVAKTLGTQPIQRRTPPRGK